MADSLRNRQREVARQSILEALTAHISEHGSVEFTVTEIADRAGVSARTVYNYFPNRHDLVEAASEWVNEAMAARGGTMLPASLVDLSEVVAPNFLMFEEMSTVAEAFARLDTVGSNTTPRQQRTEAFRQIVADAQPELSPRQVIAIGSLLRQLGSVRAWYLLTREHGLTADEAGEIVAWSFRAIIAALDTGNFPEIPESSAGD